MRRATASSARPRRPAPTARCSLPCSRRSHAPTAAPWPDTRYIGAHSVGGPGLWVTRFRREALRPHQGVHVTPTPGYWTALRKHADVVVVDAPAAERSQAGLTVAPFMDEVVLVVAADETDHRAPVQLRDDLEAVGARCAGVFVNRVQIDAPGFLRGADPVTAVVAQFPRRE